MTQYSTSYIVALSSLLLSTWLLSGCTQLSSRPYSLGPYLFEPLPSKRIPLLPNTPGVAISQTNPPQLDSITFFSDTAFSAARAKPCIDKLISLPDDETNAIIYVGRDMVNTPGRITVNTQQLGLLSRTYQIAFQLSTFGQINGVHYGFSQLGLTRAAAVDVASHNTNPISPTSPDAQLVYQSLEALYQQLDECMAEDNAADGPLEATQ
ncbi:hypothetical protein [Oceanisphaera ostreae]|uniref:Uncharacterized protein n=1 Tax=Oceanisphaera ostreae TaxID=914151 RepID=A0ABW3KJJ3_9GAMM